MDPLILTLLAVSIATNGLIAGLFFAFTCAVVSALRAALAFLTVAAI